MMVYYETTVISHHFIKIEVDSQCKHTQREYAAKQVLNNSTLTKMESVILLL